MIGLKRGTVRLAKYNPKWKENFKLEAKKIKKIFGKDIIDIWHAGSTSIPGMPAKPIMDIILAVLSLKMVSKHVKQLREIGYELKQNDKKIKQRLFFTKGPKEKRTHYLHIGKAGSAYVKDAILFRNYLIRHKNAAKEYTKLKMELAEKYQDERVFYTKKKNRFIKGIIKKARN